MYTKIEKQEMIEKAQKLIAQAVELVDEAISEDQNLIANYEAYGKYGFNQLLGLGNPHDSSLDDLIEGINEETI